VSTPAPVEQVSTPPLAVEDEDHVREAPRRRALVEVLLAAAVAVVATAVAWWRLPVDARRALWAEDGPIFLSAALVQGPAETTLAPYAGYEHVLARVLAELVAWAVPLPSLAVGVAAATCAVAGCVAGAVFVWSRAVAGSWVVRVLLGLVTVLAPVVPVEVAGNLANLHWYLLWMLPWALLAVPRTWAGSAVQAAVVLVAALTEVQALLLVPLVLVTVRRRRAWPVSGALLVGVAVQLATSVAHPRPSSTYPRPDLVDLVLSFLAQPVSSTWSSSSAGSAGLLAATSYGSAVVTLVLVLASGVVAWLLAPRARPMVVAALALAPLLWAAGIVANASGLTEYGAEGPEWLATSGWLRYAVVPSMLLLTVVLLGADGLIARRRPATVVAGAVLVAAVLVAVLPQFTVPGTLRSGAQPWAVSLEQARTACADGSVLRDEGGEALVPIAPEGWFLVSSCPVLTQR